MLGIDRRSARIAWTTALVVIALYACYRIRGTLFVFVLAVFFSYMVHPLVRWISLRAPRLSRGASTAIVFALLLVILAIGAGVLGPIVTEQASRFGDQLPRWLGDPKLIDRIPLPDWLAPYRDRLAQWIRQHLADEGPSIGPAARQIGYGLLKVAEVLITIVLVPILSFLFLKDGPTMREHYLAWAERQAHAAMWRGLMEDLDRMLGRYMRALLLLALATSVSYSIAFTIAGMPYGLLLAIGAGILEFVPVAGPLAAALATLAVAAFSGYPHLLGIVAFLVLYRLFQDYVLGPYLMGGGASVPPLLVLLGLLAGEELGGIAGVFLSVPLLAAVRVLVLRVTQAMRQPRAAATRVLAGSEHSDPPP